MTFKLHPLHTYERHFQVMQEQGVLGYHKWLEDERCTGRTTAQALQLIGAAILHPGKEFPLLDHSSRKTGDDGLAQLVSDLISGIGLKHLKVYRLGGTQYLRFGELDDQPVPGTTTPTNGQGFQ